MTKKTFETCQIELQMRSGNHFLNKISNISPPEFLILQDLHGPHAVKFLGKGEPAILKRLDHTGKWLKRAITGPEMLEKLRLKYGEIRVKAVFPGTNPILPFTFEQINIDEKNNGTTVSDVDTSVEDLWEPMEAEEAPKENAEVKTIDVKASKNKTASLV